MVEIPTKKSHKRHLETGTKITKRRKRRRLLKVESAADLDNQNVITNLSSHKLTLNETSFLNKGLNFIPYSSKISYSDMDKDIKRFERRLQLHNFFKDDEQSDSENVVAPKLHKDITEFCRLLKLEIYALCNQPKHFSNLSRYELRALLDLRKNKDIVIKKGDKNSGIVIMNRSDYETKVYNMLHDPLVYKKNRN